MDIGKLALEKKNKVILTVLCESDDFQDDPKLCKNRIENIQCDGIYHIFNDNSQNMIGSSFSLLERL